MVSFLPVDALSSLQNQPPSQAGAALPQPGARLADSADGAPAVAADRREPGQQCGGGVQRSGHGGLVAPFN